MTRSPIGNAPVLIKEGDIPRILMLIKFLDVEHVENFQAGNLRLGSVKEYRERYRGEAGKRNDAAEFLSDHHQPDRVVMKINGGRIDGIAAPILVRRNLDHRSYLLCMSAITDRFMNCGNGVQRLSSELGNLGTKAVLVTDVAEFIRRIRVAVENTPHLYSYPDSGNRISGLVEYVDFSTYHGQIGPFRKSHEYAFQLEWRVAVIDARDEIENYPANIWLEVGDLSKITTVVDSSSLSNEIVVLAKKGTQSIS